MKTRFASIHRWAVALGLGVSLAMTGALAQTDLQAGRDYTLVQPAQATETKGKIEVLEFFSYACPHCNDFDPALNEWARKAPKDVALRRIPITFGRNQWVPLAKLYYTLEAMGELDRMHSKVFEAIHRDNVTLTDENILLEWVGQQGVNRKKFNELYNSFATQSKVARAQQIAAAYKLEGVPTMAVAGKYLVTGTQAGSHANMLTRLDQLVARTRSEQPKR